LQVFRKIATFSGDSAFSTWLHRIAVNTVLMHFRKKSLNQVSLEEPYNDSDGAHIRREYGAKDSRLAGCVDRVALACAIREPPRGYRTIFLLHEVQGYDHQEIAEMLGCCAGNSKSQSAQSQVANSRAVGTFAESRVRNHSSWWITHRTRRATICEVWAVHRAECRNAADIGHSPQLIPTRWQPGVKTNYQRQARRLNAISLGDSMTAGPETKVTGGSLLHTILRHLERHDMNRVFVRMHLG
jgi:RNA polymerase sigma factor (sigma-70 family)